MAAGLKHFETRAWYPPGHVVGQRVALQAAKNLKGLDLIDVAMAADMRAHDIDPDDLPLGKIVAVGRLELVLRTETIRVVPDGSIAGMTYALGVDCGMVTATEHRWGDYTAGRYAWLFQHIRRLDDPVPFRGGQALSKFWDCPDIVGCPACTWNGYADEVDEHRATHAREPTVRDGALQPPHAATRDTAMLCPCGQPAEPSSRYCESCNAERSPARPSRTVRGTTVEQRRKMAR
jgi:hypothetical protein